MNPFFTDSCAKSKNFPHTIHVTFFEKMFSKIFCTIGLQPLISPLHCLTLQSAASVQGHTEQKWALHEEACHSIGAMFIALIVEIIREWSNCLSQIYYLASAATAWLEPPLHTLCGPLSLCVALLTLCGTVILGHLSSSHCPKSFFLFSAYFRCPMHAFDFSILFPFS